MRRLRVLVIAEAANPEWVSVPLIGWSLSQALSKVADVHIVTQLRNADAFRRQGLEEGRDFTAIDSEKLAAPMWKLGEKLRLGEGKGWTMLQAVAALSYPYFERQVWKRFGGALAAGEYDIVHRVTPLSPTAASPIARRLAGVGVPFVVGPLNGGVPWPKGFDRERRREREWLSYVRSAYKLLPGRDATLKHAAAILTGSLHTRSEIPTRFAEKCVYIPENAIDPSRFSRPPEQRSDGPLRLCFVGRMVPYKGPDMLLEAAMPLLRSGKAQLDMVGDGPLLDQLKAAVSEEGVEQAVRFHGWLAHSEVQNVLAQAHLLPFPSVREFGGGVVLEATALGAVPIVVDYAGPGELVSDEVGYKIALGTRREIVDGMRSALVRIAENTSDLAALSDAGRRRIQQDYTWDAKAGQILEVYRWVRGEAEKPAPFGY